MRDMLKTILVPLALALLLILSNGSDNSATRLKQAHKGSDNSVAHVKQINNGSDNSVARFKQNSAESAKSQTGTLEKMIVADGSVAMDIDLGRLKGNSSPEQMNALRFDVVPNSFFTILVFNNALRGPESGSMALIPQSFAILPAALNESFNQ